MCVCVFVCISLWNSVYSMCIWEIKFPETELEKVLETFGYLGFYAENLKLVKSILKNILDLKNCTLKMNLS